MIIPLLNNIYINLFCKKVGEDDFGNRYYVGKRKNYLGKNKRYVVYNGDVDFANIPAAWHSWLHYLINDIPSVDSLNLLDWQCQRTNDMFKVSLDTVSSSINKKFYSSWVPNSN